jgi:hypothetical protein
VAVVIPRSDVVLVILRSPVVRRATKDPQSSRHFADPSGLGRRESLRMTAGAQTGVPQDDG